MQWCMLLALPSRQQTSIDNIAYTINRYSAVPLTFTCLQISTLKVAAQRKNVMHVALEEVAANLSKLRQAAAAQQNGLELWASSAQGGTST